MPGWAGSTRRDRLPANWRQLREQVKARAAGQCEHTTNGTRCTAAGNQCDHIVRGDDHSLSNLQWLCEPHHREKSSSEGGRAARRPRRSTRREPEAHPGLIGPRHPRTIPSPGRWLPLRV